MRRAILLVAASLVAACGGSDTPVTAGYGGSVGSGGATSGSGGATSGSGGTTSGSGGTTSGSGGATSGSGGADAAVDSGARSYCGCSTATAQDETAKSAVTITVSGFTYNPACIKVKTGTTVTFSADFTVHPLAPETSVSDPSNPVKAVSTGTSSDVVFASAGFYGYFCTHHVSLDMCGAVYVVP
jgi:plastocyanin